MRIPDSFLKCVSFLGYPKDGTFRWGGTGFYVGVEFQGGKFNAAMYVVTAQHVVNEIAEQTDGRVFVRVNSREGGVAIIETLAKHWRVHPTTDTDVAVHPLNVGRFPEIEYRWLSSKMFATPEVLEAEEIGVGDDVLMCGLFTSHYGERRNLPIMRMGHIAAMPSDAMVVSLGQKVPTKAKVAAYLVEARSIGGLSGSPVFVHIGPWRIKDRKVKFVENRLVLIGLMYGHWTKEVAPEPAVVFDEDVRDRYHTGIGIVIPATDILGVLEHPDFEEGRRQLAAVPKDQGEEEGAEPTVKAAGERDAENK